MFIPLLALLGSSLRSAELFLKKYGIKKKIDNCFIVWAIIFGVIAASFLLFFIPTPKTDLLFWTVCTLSGISWLIGDMLQIKAVETLDVSKIIPLYSFGLVFTGIAGWIFLGEFPSLLGFIGLSLIIIGGYFIELKKFDFRKIFLPFSVLLSQKGAPLIFISFIFYAISQSLDKIGVLHSQNTLFYGIMNHIIAMSLFTIFIFRKLVSKRRQLLSNKLFLISIGIINVSYSFISMFLYNFMEVVYVMAIFKLEILFNVLGGYFIFREDNFLHKLIAGLLISAGVVLVLLG